MYKGEFRQDSFFLTLGTSNSRERESVAFGVLFLHTVKDATAKTKVKVWKVIFHIHLITTLVQGIF